ncbi:hypothetical protein LTR56_000167 [Elasticomyces elasticus]|nr:hypothetical protein LTR56_000167 [Elasticomyces elasticus]KAK3667155.1 hypothetical protein LTR22_002020 [Elasticomyces elasticus]KAK4932929.1 hypothetical protein LTR49_000886 [Elasticomyces elasticus]KAK5768666.1 hypothetical protein LTS12_001091 [Elasticomyces elasticus]
MDQDPSSRPHPSQYPKMEGHDDPVELQQLASSHLLSRQPSPSTSKHDEMVGAVPTHTFTDDPPIGVSPLSWKWLTYTAVVIISAILPVVVLVSWLSLTHSGTARPKFTSFSSEKIGGKLTQAQAKAIDVVCSVVFAPGLMAALDYFWFSNARVAAVNERHDGKGIPLDTLAAASNLSSGTYDSMTTLSLLRGKTWRLLLLAVLVLVAAVARSAVTNILAYEAYSEVRFFASTADLRYLADTAIDFGRTQDIAEYGYNSSQQALVANKVTGLLTGLNYEGASSKLIDGAYVGANATTESMNKQPAAVVKLYDVPGFRLTVNCATHQPDYIGVTARGGYVTDVLFLVTSELPDGGRYRASYPGVPTQLTTSYNDVYQFAAFSLDAEEVYLAFLTSFNGSTNVKSSVYGPIIPVAQNMTGQGVNGIDTGFGGTKTIMSFWGITCSVYRQEGLLNYTRESSDEWKLAASRFDDHSRRVPSPLPPWQTNLQYHAPRSAIPGIGPAIALSAQGGEISVNLPMNISYENLAHNYLYAAGEVERIVYEVSASDLSRDTDDLVYSYLSDGMRMVEYYRMTYVPAILMTGLVSLLAAAGAALGLSVYVSGTCSTREYRKVDAIRLIIDAIEGLGHDREATTNTNNKEYSPNHVDKIAQNCKVEYIETVEGGRVTVRLRTT